MSLVETMSDKSGVIASGMLDISGIHIKTNVHFNPSENKENVRHSKQILLKLDLLPKSTAACVGEVTHKSCTAPSI